MRASDLLKRHDSRIAAALLERAFSFAHGIGSGYGALGRSLSRGVSDEHGFDGSLSCSVRLRLLDDLIALSGLTSYPSNCHRRAPYAESLPLPDPPRVQRGPKSFCDRRGCDERTVERCLGARDSHRGRRQHRRDRAEVGNRLASRHPVVRIIRHPRNRGYGAALRSGFAAARCDLVFFTDSDGQFRFDQVAEFMASIDAFDMVLGYRADRQDRWLRKANSRVGNWLARTLLGVRAKDINCAYKLFHRDLFQRLPLTSEGAMINTELLALAAYAGWTFHEIAVAHYPRKCGVATGAKFQVVVRTFAEYFQLRRRMADLRRS